MYIYISTHINEYTHIIHEYNDTIIYSFIGIDPDADLVPLRAVIALIDWIRRLCKYILRRTVGGCQMPVGVLPCKPDVNQI